MAKRKLEERATLPIVLLIGGLVIALAVYFVILGSRALRLFSHGSVVSIGLGVGIIILPLLGVWMVAATIFSGLTHQRLARRIALEGKELDISTLPRLASGRIEKDAADALFAEEKERWEADPTDWRNTYRIARAYDYAGDRGRAREMMKRAVAQERSEVASEFGEK